jgi:SAM-dependent methyltransferase
MNDEARARGSSGGSTGSGPGVITPDGCAVDFYALMPPGDEPGIVHAAAGRPDAAILELGSGTGRVTSALVQLGHPVVAVGESPQMLAHIRTADTVCARIEGLDLGRRFDVVVLASHLLNVPDDQTRQALLHTCARHVSRAGCVLIQHHPPQWFARATAAERQAGEIILRMRDVSRPGSELVTATVEYQVGDRVWTQTFTAMRLDEESLKSALGEAGLRLDRYLTDHHAWFRAVTAAAGGQSE